MLARLLAVTFNLTDCALKAEPAISNTLSKAIVVEVISPSDRYTDVEDKVVEWLEAGCRMVIVVNPRQRVVTVYHARTDIVMLTEEDTLDGGDVVPGWQLPINDVFG